MSSITLTASSNFLATSACGFTFAARRRRVDRLKQPGQLNTVRSTLLLERLAARSNFILSGKMRLVTVNQVRIVEPCTFFGSMLSAETGLKSLKVIRLRTLHRTKNDFNRNNSIGYRKAANAFIALCLTCSVHEALK